MFFKVYLHLPLWPRFSLPQLCCNNIYVVTILKITNKSRQNLFNCSQRTSMDYCKVRIWALLYGLIKKNYQNMHTIRLVILTLILLLIQGQECITTSCAVTKSSILRCVIHSTVCIIWEDFVVPSSLNFKPLW